ncbi:protealysin inhibitor emfourin [Streptomyces griseosporeus]|uniref:protealysin inhibitor emfourin n=1 Tax=Streptomyces griseosporeus TaxID=1910 RepID=UPI003700B5FE
MKVTLTTHGGQAAAVRLGLPPRVLDTDALPEDASAELARLVAAAAPTSRPAAGEGRPPGRARDAMSYRITVEDAGRTTVLAQSDATMSREFADLVGWLEEHFAQQ